LRSGCRCNCVRDVDATAHGMQMQVRFFFHFHALRRYGALVVLRMSSQRGLVVQC